MRSTESINTSGGNLESDFVANALEKEDKNGTDVFSTAFANMLTVLLMSRDTALASGLFPRPMPTSTLMPVSRLEFLPPPLAAAAPAWS